MMLLKILISSAFLCLINGEIYLESPPFSKETAHGMSRARSPTYDYEFDPEMVLGYARQDSTHNGTVVSANGKYFITTEDKVTKDFYVRIDARNCQRYPEHAPRICFCYETHNSTINDPICDNMKGFVHICQNVNEIVNSKAKDANVKGTTFTKNKPNEDLGNYLSYHIRFIYADGSEQVSTTVTGTNNLAGGLHQANRDYYNKYTTSNSPDFVLHRLTQLKLYPVKTHRYHVLGKPDVTTLGVELYFPKKPKDNDEPDVVNCVRLDFHGLMFAGALLQEKRENAVVPIYQVPYKLTAATDKDIRPKGTRDPINDEIPRPNPVGKDACDLTCCPLKNPK